MAPGNTFLTVGIMAGDKSVVTVLMALRMSGEEDCAQDMACRICRHAAYHTTSVPLRP